MTVKEFLFDSPIYQVVPKDNCEDVINFIKGLGSKEVDGYNPIEKCDSTFVLFCSIYYTVQSGPFGGISHTSYLSGKHETFKTYELILKCKRYGSFLHLSLIHI